MSQKNFASYGDMETLVTEIADKCGPYTEISYEDWLQLTPYQQEHGRWDVTGVPGADGTISIDLMTKLWENESPTQAMASDTEISINDANYDLLAYVCFIRSTNNKVIPLVLTPKNKDAYVCYADSGNALQRRFDYANSIITAKTGYIGSTVDNTYIILYQIYGIKLHHTIEMKAIAPTVSTLAENCVFDPTGTELESTDVEAAIKELESNFQDGVDAVYDAVVAKGSTPASHSLSDVVTGIGNIPTGITPSGTKSITANGTNIDVTEYAKVDVAVPNTNSGTYTASSRSSALDMGATNSYRYVNTNGVPKGVPAYSSMVVNRSVISNGQTVSFTATSGHLYLIAGQNYQDGTASYLGYVNASGSLAHIVNTSWLTITKSSSKFTIKNNGDEDRWIISVFNCIVS